MPQASEELREEWNGPGWDCAMNYLTERGYVLKDDFTWSAPHGVVPTTKDCSAVEFLMDEWDWGPITETSGIFTKEPS